MFLASRKIIESVDNAWYVLGGVSLVLFIGIMGCLVWFVIKYHRSRHPKAEHIPGNMKLEILWTVLPTLLSIWLFFVGLEGFQLMRNPPADAYVIDVEGRRWAWTFTYPKDGVSVPTRLVVPVDTPIRANLSAPIDDVLHSFYLPDFRVKEDCVPGMPTYLWFEADRVTATLAELSLEVEGEPETYAGHHNIFCAEFCGQGHSDMLGRMYVLSKEEFEAYLVQKIEHRFRAVEIDKVMVASSEELAACKPAELYGTLCAQCHGPGGGGEGIKDARNFQTLEGWKPEPHGPTITGIFRTLTLGIEGAQMRAFSNLSAWDRFALAYYVADFYKGSDRPESTREDFEALIKEFGLDKQQKIQRKFPIEKTIEDMAEEAEKGG